MSPQTQDIPYRMFLFNFYGAFFRGEINNSWRDSWNDASTIATALTGNEHRTSLPDELSMKRAFATAFYGVGKETLPLAQSCWENDKRLNCGEACKRCREKYAELGLVSNSFNNLPEDHIGLVLAFASILLQENKAHELPAFLSDTLAAWWPYAESAMKKRSEWETLAPVLSSFSDFLKTEISKQES